MPAGLPDGFAAQAPPLPRPVVLGQDWTSLTFVHWPVEPAGVAHLFPRGTRPDVFTDGLTYVALVPFAMRRAGFGREHAVPYLGTFLETNIRLYSVDDEGRHGVLFRSLDATRLPVVFFARAVFGMNYTWSRMRSSYSDGVQTYDSERVWPRRGLASHLRVRIGERVEPTPLEVFLTARWGAHSRVAGRTVWVPNEHGPWPLHSAEVLDLRDDLLAAGGVTPCGPPLRALWSPGVRSHFGRPTPLRQVSGRSRGSVGADR